MTTEQFAEQFRLRIAHDECGDKIIPGKRGHLYCAGGELCLMVVDGAPPIEAAGRHSGGSCGWVILAVIRLDEEFRT
jgi:hypothetical protein